MLKILGATLILMQASIAFGMGQKLPSESGDYCKDEAVQYLRRKFGTEFKIESVKKFGSGQQWNYWAKTDLCDGHFVMEYMDMESSMCKTVQYGRATRYLDQVWGDGECKALINVDRFPRR